MSVRYEVSMSWRAMLERKFIFDWKNVLNIYHVRSRFSILIAEGRRP